MTLDPRDKAAVDRAVRNGPDALRFVLGSYEDITDRPVTEEMRAYHEEQMDALRERQKQDDLHSLPIDESIGKTGYQQIVKRGD